MTGSLLPVPGLRAVDANGAPLPGALLSFYLSGTTTPTPVYANASLTTPLSNPVVADSTGLFPAIYVDPTITYRAILMTGAAVLVRDTDPVATPSTPAAGSITGAMLASGAAVANLGFTPVNKAGDTRDQPHHRQHRLRHQLGRLSLRHPQHPERQLQLRADRRRQQRGVRHHRRLHLDDPDLRHGRLPARSGDPGAQPRARLAHPGARLGRRQRRAAHRRLGDQQGCQPGAMGLRLPGVRRAERVGGCGTGIS